MYEKDPCLTRNYSPFSPHSIIPTLIQANSIMLDVGCNTGYLGQALQEKNVTSDGVDLNEEAMLAATPYYRQTFHRDLSLQELNLPDTGGYDYIVMSDILEHLARPDLLLSDCRRYLKRDGRIIASIPNVARLEIRIKLLLGQFEYDRGILNEDHLRFFTRKSASDLFVKQGYAIERILPTGMGARIKIFPRLTAFQFIFVCRPQADIQ